MAYEIQFARITNAGKLSDRFLTSKHLEPDDLAKTHMGRIFALIEILSPWFPTAQVGQMIINNFAKNYYQSGSTSDLDNFENALKHVNEDLAQATQNGETDWIGNLNGFLAILVGNNLHLSPTGKVQAYIFRDGKINHLTYGMPVAPESHPLKTFSNIISGELKEHDKILLTNQDLFNHLTLETLRQIITLNNPSEAALQISKILRKEKERNVNLIIINLLSKEELSNQTAATLENVYYLDKHPEKFSLKVGSIVAPLANFTKRIIQGITSAFSKIFAKKSKPEVKETSENRDRFHKEFLSSDQRDDGLLKDEEIKYSPEYVHYYASKGKEVPSNKWSKILLTVWTRIQSFFSWVYALSKDRQRRKYLYIALAIILIIIIALIVTLRGRGTKVGHLESQKILEQAIAAQKEGKTLLSSGKQDQAKEKFVLSIQKAEEILNNSLVSKDAKNTIESSYQELDKLTATTRFNSLQAIITVPEQPKGFFVVAGSAFIATDSDIYEANIIGGSPSKVATLTKSKGSFVAGTRADKILYLYTSDQNLYEFDTSSKKLIPLALATDAHWETANAITNYVGTLYLLDGVVGQIYKHTSSQDEFQNGIEYISSAIIDLKKSNSIAIDGAVYVLKNNGQVVKLVRSSRQDFTLKNIPSPFETITNPVKIFTDTDTPSIYILDSGEKRILEFDKTGQFVHQYALPIEFNNIIDFVVNVKSRKIWILDKTSIYEISI